MDRYGYVYISKCAATGKRYIGQHKGPKDPSYIGSGALIKESLREHGLKNHSVRVVEYADDNEDLNAKEIKWIARTQADISDDYLNISDLPGGGYRGPRWWGYKISAALKGIKRSDETKRRISEAKKGKTIKMSLKGPMTDAHKEKIRQANTGREKGSEERQNIKSAAKQSWQPGGARRKHYDKYGK